MKLIVEPDDGVKPLIKAIDGAKKSITMVVFRFDLADLEKALKAACKRGVAVHVLVAHTTSKSEKPLRKLESRLLEYGATVARTDDDMVRYHGKLVIIDKDVLFVLGFNYTNLDMRRSRSFGIVTRKAAAVREAQRLIRADEDRSEKFRARKTDLVISPENARTRLTQFIRKATHHLLIYDSCLTDDAMIGELRKRAKAGVRIKILGRLEKKWRGKRLKARTLYRRLHVRAMMRDGRRAFVGSQSMRRLELDERREVGVIVRDVAIVKRLERIFESDWSKS
jgi:phosphatidylserine/phosphatidylglycerophosphate/cardiolipin synthase-like enzyme